MSETGSRFRIGLVKVMVVVAGILVAVIGGAHISARADADADILPIVEAGSHQAVQAVFSGKGTVAVRHVEVNAPEGPVYETETIYKLAFSGDKYRMSTQTTVLRNDVKSGIDPSLMRQVGSVEMIETAVAGDNITFVKKRDTQNVATIGSSASKMAGMILNTLVRDVRPGVGWLGKGLVDIGELRADEILFSRLTKTVVGREVVDGNECIMVEIKGIYASGDRPTSTLVYWVDPQKGYAVPRTRYFLQGGRWTERTLVAEETVELREYRPGIWYPAKITLDHYSTRDPAKYYKDLSKVVSYSPDFQVNVPVSEAELALDLPSGTEVHNEVLDAYYAIQ